MNWSNWWRVGRWLRTRTLLFGTICFSFALLFPTIATSQVNLSLESQARQWLMQDAPPNPPLQAWLDGISMLIKEEKNIDAPVQVTSSVLPNGLVQVQAKIGPNIYLWQVDYPRRKYFSMTKQTVDLMDLLAKQKPLR